MNKTFQCPHHWLDQKIDIIVVGAGGTGSNLIDALSQLHHGLIAVGHHGINVQVFDDDTVDIPNIGRQRFTMADVGNNKAITLVNRYNLAYGLNWTAHPIRFEGEVMAEACPDLLITCVDTARTRVDIAQTLCVSRDDDDLMWLDFGNGKSEGQVICGGLNDHADRLPNVFDLYPELEDMEEDNEPSCSLAEAIRKQDLFINRTIVDAGINILWQLLRRGSIDHHGVFINQQTSEVTPLKVNPDVWRFMGYEATA